MANRKVLISPSILSADFTKLGEQVAEAERAGADRIHVDVMDGHFVPNLSLGPEIVRSLRPVTRLPLEVHLMVEQPDRFVDLFAEAGADAIYVHIEAAVHLHRTVQHIKSLGRKAGVVLNPVTATISLQEILPDIDLVLVMTVNPGWAGQKFIASSLGKISRVRQLIDRTRPEIDLEVDGGIDPQTAPEAVKAGANVLVAASAVFRTKEGITAAMGRLRGSVAG